MEKIENSYLNFFTLSKFPFDEANDTSFFFESDDHLEALERLNYIVQDGNMNFGLLTGEVGSGKSLLRMVLEKRLDSDKTETIVLENSFFPFDDIMFEILTQMSRVSGGKFFKADELPQRGDKYGLFSSFKNALSVLYEKEARKLLLILDEAQQLEPEELDELKNLTNLAREGTNLVTIILVGQPELREKIRNIKQVDQRVSLRFHLNNLHFDDTQKYVEHRLKVAGHPNGKIFTRSAIEVLFRYTLGVPREINRACKLSLEHAFANDRDLVEDEVVKTVLEDLERHRL